MTFKVLIFDLGNVVAFFDHRRATDRIAPHARVPHDELHHLLHASPLAARYERGETTTDEFRSSIRREVPLDCSDEFFDESYGDIFQANDELADLIPTLAARYPLHLLSNTNELHARRFLKLCRPTLAHFRTLFLSHEVKMRKPEPRIYRHVADRIGHAPSEILFFDDIEANIEAARAAGWNAILFTSVEDVRAACGEE